MTININELRRLAQAALAGPDGISLNWIKLLQDFQQKANPAAISEFLDRLEAAEKSDAESIAMYRKARDERDELRAKIEAMERQEPVAFALYSGWARKAVYLSEIEACEQRDHRQLTADLGGSLEAYRVVPLYRAPGAQPAPSIPEGVKKAVRLIDGLAGPR